MSSPKITKTIVQKLDGEGKVLSEVITTVEERPVEDNNEQAYGMYL